MFKPSVPEEDIELAARAVWLSYVGGYNQAAIADRLGVSRIKVHRLISLAHELGLVKVHIEHQLAELAALEEQLINRYRLTSCIVVPALGTGDGATDTDLTALGMAGARFLRRQMAAGAGKVIGIGWGRTLAAVADQMRRASNDRQHRFVALIGSLTRQSAANPYDVIHRLVDGTGSQGYYLPVPYIADTLADKQVLTSQKSVQDILALAARCDVCLVGIGQCSEKAFLPSLGLITAAEFAELRAAGAVGDLIGKFFDHRGRLVDSEINQRSIGIGLDQLGACRAVAVAGGADKTAAIRAALASGVLAGLITDETVARALALPPDIDTDMPGRRVAQRRRAAAL